MSIIFLITKLKAGVSRESYEEWARTRDYPFMAALKSVVSFNIHRIEGNITGAEQAGWMYLERIEVSSLENYEKELATEEGKKLREELFLLVDRPKNIRFLTNIV